MGGQTAELAFMVIFGVPPFRVVELVDIRISNGIEDCESEVCGIGGVEQGLYSIFSAW